MALSTIGTNSIADDAVGNTKLDLTANYAFTGTITGVPSGLTKITSHTIQAVNEFNITSIFSSTYDNYRIIASGIGVLSTNGEATFRLIDSSGSNVTSNYVNSAIGYAGGAGGAQRSGGFWRFHVHSSMYANTNATQAPMISMDIFNPFNSSPTKFAGVTHYRNAGNSAWITEACAGHNENNTSCTGLNFVPDSGQTFGNGSGYTKIAVYGYQA
jgi:hypothetical protein|tara:strand:- start:228 stop:869 length:642 start_codon:yes stop_codon:yes gene_type:complete